MQHQVLVFPVLPGKTEADARAIGDEMMRRPEEYRESRRRQGIAVERAYLQTTPMGLFVVVYAESEGGFDQAVAGVASSDLPIDEYFRDAVLATHGFDMTAPPAGPAPETLAVWSDPDVTTRGTGLAFCAPVLPGRADAGRAFAKDAYSRSEFAASRRDKGISREVVTLLQSPHGDLIAVYAEGSDPIDGNAKFAASQEPFDVWFKEEAGKLSPPEVDFSQPIEGVVEIFDSNNIA